MLLSKDVLGKYNQIEYKNINFMNEICEIKPDNYMQYSIISSEQVNDKSRVLKILNNRNGLRERAIKKCSQVLEKAAMKQYSNITFREDMYSAEIEKYTKEVERIRNRVKNASDREKVSFVTDVELLKSELLKTKSEIELEERLIVQKLEVIREKILRMQVEEDKRYENSVQDCFNKLVKRFLPDSFDEQEIPNYCEYDCMSCFSSDELQMLAIARYIAVSETNLQRFPEYNETCEVIMLDFDFLNQKLVYLNAVLSYLYEQNKQVIIVKRLKSVEKVHCLCSNTFLVS